MEIGRPSSPGSVSSTTPGSRPASPSGTPPPDLDLLADLEAGESEDGSDRDYDGDIDLDEFHELPAADEDDAEGAEGAEGVDGDEGGAGGFVHGQGEAPPPDADLELGVAEPLVEGAPELAGQGQGPEGQVPVRTRIPSWLATGTGGLIGALLFMRFGTLPGAVGSLVGAQVNTGLSALRFLFHGDRPQRLRLADVTALAGDMVMIEAAALLDFDEGIRTVGFLLLVREIISHGGAPAGDRGL